MSIIRVADLFAGIGGIRLGMHQALGRNARTVYASEWNKYSVQTYQANWHDGFDIDGDITKVATESIPDIDLLLAGFPCQPFSIAGVSKKNSLGRPTGFQDKTQGTLFFDVARIIEAKQPQAFLLENVKNLLSHDQGRTFATIHSVLTEDLGYHVQYKVIDATGFVPQHRERTYIVGFKETNDFNFDTIKPIRHGNVGSILLPVEEVPDKYILSDKLWAYLQSYAAKHKAAGNGFGYGLVDEKTERTRTLSARYYKDGSEILIDRGENKNPRRLTPRECARLMGYPDDFIIPVSDTQAYKQFGNSVAVPVIKAIGKAMKPYIVHRKRQSTIVVSD
jgi:DNA (cytosine-5)-methyltransferase 1